MSADIEINEAITCILLLMETSYITESTLLLNPKYIDGKTGTSKVNIRDAREGEAKEDAEPVLDVFLVSGKLVTCLFLAVAFTSNLQLVQATGDMYPF